jgi:hypothetical protein
MTSLAATLSAQQASQQAAAPKPVQEKKYLLALELDSDAPKLESVKVDGQVCQAIFIFSKIRRMT